MKNVGVLPNDLLLIDRKKEVKDKDMVVTSVEGGVVVKRLDIIAGESISENEDFQSIKITNSSNFHVCGVVIRVIRDL